MMHAGKLPCAPYTNTLKPKHHQTTQHPHLHPAPCTPCPSPFRFSVTRSTSFISIPNTDISLACAMATTTWGSLRALLSPLKSSANSCAQSKD